MAIKKIILLLILFLTVKAASYAQNSTDVVLEIEEMKITADEFLHVFNKNRGEKSRNSKSDMLEYLDFFTKFKVKIYEAKEQKLDKNRDFKQELAQHEAQLKKSFLLKRNVTETMLSNCYEKSKFELNVSHVLVNCKPNASPKDSLLAYNKILSLKEKLGEGIPFDTLAKTYSDDPSAKKNFGNIGYISTFNTVHQFENQAYRTKVGQVSEIVRTQFGYHLIHVLDKRKNLGKIEVAQLFLSCPNDAPQEIQEAKEKQIHTIHNSISTQKMPFEKAVAEYSQESYSKKNDGKINAFKRGDKAANYESAAFALSLQEPISQPFLTEKGWYILKLVKKHALKSFAEERESLTKKLLKDDRSKLPDAQFIKSIQEENAYKVNAFYKTALFKKLLNDGLRKNWKLKTYQTYKNPLFQIGDKEFSQFDFLKFLKLQNKITSEKLTKELLEKKFESYVSKRCVDYASQHLSKNNLDYKYLLQEYEEGILLFNLTQKEIWDKSQEDSIALEHFYKKNKHNYLWAKRANASIYKSKSAKKIKKVLKFLTKGKPEQKILKKIPTLNIEKGNFEEGKNKYLDSHDWTVRISPVLKWGDEFVLINIDEVLKPVSKKLNEARGYIMADYQEELTRLWEEKLMKKYKIKINKSALDKL